MRQRPGNQPFHPTNLTGVEHIFIGQCRKGRILPFPCQIVPMRSGGNDAISLDLLHQTVDWNTINGLYVASFRYGDLLAAETEIVP